jgi:hypothetical protein
VCFIRNEAGTASDLNTCVEKYPSYKRSVFIGLLSEGQVTDFNHAHLQKNYKNYKTNHKNNKSPHKQEKMEIKFTRKSQKIEKSQK